LGGGAAAKAKGTNLGLGDLTVSASATAGNGGAGVSGAKGGAGGASTLTNAVSGSTGGGKLYLNQTAVGGAGGSSTGATGGAGGKATSNLTFDDTPHTTHASLVQGYSHAIGGAGSAGTTKGGAGGAAMASLTLTGAFSVTATTKASGGAGVVGAAGGNSTATSDAIGTTSITSSAMATGGNGGASGGTASATAIGQGASGDANATAVAGSITSGSLVTAASANADTPVAGTSTAKTWAATRNGAISAPALVLDQAVAQITAEPKSTDVSAINAANTNINTAFHTGKTPVYFGIGELGGEYSPSASGSETETSSVHMTVDLTKAGTLHDLIIGFYSGTAAGAGFTSMSLDVKINGTDHNTSFATVAAADAFFKNNFVDYGALGAGGWTTPLQLDISLSITESAAGGYDFGMLIGDPPPAHQGNALAALGQAAASFTPGSAANAGGLGPAQQDNDAPVLATPHAVT
jgi:hypothetical protein